jgi:hypothetical protein
MIPSQSSAYGKPRLSAGVLPLIVGLAVAVVYANSLLGAFVLDDEPGIVENAHIRQGMGAFVRSELWRSRGAVDLTFALNHAWGGLDPFGYHGTNLLLHVAAALALFGLVRRAVGGAGPAAETTAFWAALLWGVHPLTTSAVTYLSQRYEVAMALAFLSTLYALTRGADETRAGPRRAWYGWAVLVCGIGMLCKEVMVTAPIAALLYDRAFLAGRWREVAKRRWGVHLGLMLTWVVLAGALARGAATGGVDAALPAGVSWRYAWTQAGVLVHYLKLTVAPYPLCLDYAWPLNGGAAEVWPQLLVVAVLLAATAWAWRRAPRAAFPAVVFFLVLAPTSSVLPRPDAAFEHRMYLPLAALAALASADWVRLAGRAGSRLRGCWTSSERRTRNAEGSTTRGVKFGTRWRWRGSRAWIRPAWNGGCAPTSPVRLSAWGWRITFAP